MADQGKVLDETTVPTMEVEVQIGHMPDGSFAVKWANGDAFSTLAFLEHARMMVLSQIKFNKPKRISKVLALPGGMKH